MRIAFAAKPTADQLYAKQLADNLQLNWTTLDDDQYDYLLVLTATRLELVSRRTNVNPIAVDFVSGAMAHRLRYGGGKGQLIAKAVGLSKKPDLTVLDLTAGLGRDAFVLANLGASVTMLERSPIIAALLMDGLHRAQQVAWVKALSMHFIQTDAKSYLLPLVESDYPDVIYLDPMFPEREKSALVKKEMRILRDLVGDDVDADAILSLALSRAKRRVVVKRPRHASPLPGPSVTQTFLGKSSRYDMYLPEC